MILDGDLGMGNVDIMFGIRTSRTVHEVLKGDLELSDVLVEVAPRITLIPGGSGITELQNLSDQQKRALLDQVATLPENFDYLIVDTAPGIDDNVLYLNAAVHQIIVVLTPDPASMADSYALIKVLNKYHRENRFSIICNQVRDEAEGLALFRKLSDVASRFLFVSLDYQGSIPSDSNLNRATRSQQLVVSTNPHTPSSQSIQHITQKVCGFSSIKPVKGGMQFFWEQSIRVA